VKKTLLFCLMALVCAFAQQKQRLAVLPSVGELEPKKMDLLTDKVREIASKTLPQSGFILLKQDAVIEAIGTEEYFVACKEGTCIGELAKKANANFGARCDVYTVDSSLVLKFELYSVNDEAILETFTDYESKDFYKMLAVLEERLPGAFQKMIPVEAPPPVVVPPPSVVESPKQVDTEIPKVEKSNTSFWVGLGLEAFGAVMIGAGYVKEMQAKEAYTKYKELKPNGSFGASWNNVEEQRSFRNVFYGIGGVLLVSGIGVHIWF